MFGILVINLLISVIRTAAFQEKQIFYNHNKEFFYFVQLKKRNQLYNILENLSKNITVITVSRLPILTGQHVIYCEEFDRFVDENTIVQSTKASQMTIETKGDSGLPTFPSPFHENNVPDQSNLRFRNCKSIKDRFFRKAESSNVARRKRDTMTNNVLALVKYGKWCGLRAGPYDFKTKCCYKKCSRSEFDKCRKKGCQDPIDAFDDLCAEVKYCHICNYGAYGNKNCKCEKLFYDKLHNFDCSKSLKPMDCSKKIKIYKDLLLKSSCYCSQIVAYKSLCPTSCGMEGLQTCQRACDIKKKVGWTQDSFYGCLTLSDFDPDPILKHIFEEKLKESDDE